MLFYIPFCCLINMMQSAFYLKVTIRIKNTKAYNYVLVLQFAFVMYKQIINAATVQL